MSYIVAVVFCVMILTMRYIVAVVFREMVVMRIAVVFHLLS